MDEKEKRPSVPNRQPMGIQNKEELRPLERFLLIVYTLHHVGLISVGLRFMEEWHMWPSVLMAVFLIASWAIYFVSPKDFHFRGALYSILVLTSLAIYTVFSLHYNAVFLQICSVIVLMGLCGYVDYTYIALTYIAFITLHHVFINRTFDFRSSMFLFDLVIPLANLLLIAFAIHFWVSRRQESVNRTQRVIQKLVVAEKTKDDFMANVSHEIRTPINTIQGMSELLLQETDSARRDEQLRAIQGAGRSLMGVVTDILDFSELQSGNIALIEEDYDTATLITDLVNISMADRIGTNLDLMVDVDQNIPKTLRGDERKIRRIVMNLVSNAFKFTKDGGVALEFGYRRESYGANFIIAVRDTGIGLDEEGVEKLFTTYNQVDTGRARREGGVGLGLAIAYAMTQAMGGIITVKSKPDKGTMMQVTIPQKVVNEAPMIQLENPEQYRMLVYIDMEHLKIAELRDTYRLILDHMAKQFGTHYHFCRNFQELRRRLDREPYTHLFMTLQDYLDNREFYNHLSEQMTVTVLADPEEADQITGKSIIRMSRPVYALPVKQILEGSRDTKAINHPESVSDFKTSGVEAMVVDDNQMNIKVMEGLLGRYQIHVTSAQSGFEAIEKIYEHHYDFIFMDYMMPEMDGIEALQHIRAKGDRYCTKVPVVAVTANAVSGVREKLLSAGFDEYLEKPVENATLERVLMKILPEDKLEFLKGGHLRETSERNAPQAQEDFLQNLGLNTQNGLLYCGGRDLYIDVLREYVRKGEENFRPIEESYAARDWKNYVIYVHAVKSSMKIIGAEEVSELAKTMEAQGKAQNYAYIEANHEKLMEQYRGIIHRLEACPQLNKSAGETKSEMATEELSTEQFETLLQQFEACVYELEGEQMLQILDELEKYSYGGSLLKEHLKSARHKVEMSDYMSALEALGKVKDRLQKTDGGQA